MKTKLEKGQRTCPKCNSDWDGGSILDEFKRQRDSGLYWIGMSDEQLEVEMKKYYSPPYRWGREIGVEVSELYDGISYWECPDCHTHFDGFTGLEV
jgi:rubredoxin